MSIGPGTALKSMLSSIGITSSPDCACHRHADEMDRNGADWCEGNVPTIVAWLQEEATRRGIPFFAPGARMLVRQAIAIARSSGAPRSFWHIPGGTVVKKDCGCAKTTPQPPGQ